jgi:DNA-binding PadR family transcriptional regulator
MPEAQGALTEAVFYILLSLTQPMHGYGIMQNVSELSRGRVVLGAGTLYGAINTQLEKGWITPYGGLSSDRRKEYIITPAGRRAAEAEVARLSELLENGRRILEGAKQ